MVESLVLDCYYECFSGEEFHFGGSTARVCREVGMSDVNVVVIHVYIEYSGLNTSVCDRYAFEINIESTN